MEDVPHTQQMAMMRRDLQRSGYYPDLLIHVIEIALGGQDVVSYLIQPETAFDSEEVYRHLTAMVLTPTRLIGVHVDEDHDPTESKAIASTEAVPLSRVRSVALSHGISDPAHKDNFTVETLTLSVSWGNISRMEIEPAICADPHCDADHGYHGLITGDDLILRFSALADGREGIERALHFATEFSAAIARSSEK